MWCTGLHPTLGTSWIGFDSLLPDLAALVELVYTPVLETGAEGHESSTLSGGTLGGLAQMAEATDSNPVQ